MNRKLISSRCLVGKLQGPAIFLQYGFDMKFFILCLPDHLVSFSFLAVLIACLSVLPAHAGLPDQVILDTLRGSPKLSRPDEIMSAFQQPGEMSRVIVTMKTPAAAAALEQKSGGHVGDQAGSPKQGVSGRYDLADQSVRSSLKETVQGEVERVLTEIGPGGLQVHQRFSYQFGFAAEVTPAALERLLNHPDVVSVEPDLVLEQHLAQGISLMNAAGVRAKYDGSGVSIAICDTGIDTSHPRLGGGGFPNTKVIGGYDTGDNDSNPRPDRSYGDPHGTACAGIAAGDTGTVRDYIGGVAPGAKLYAIKISTGDTGEAYLSAMVAGWEWAITHQYDDPANPIMIISTSFGGDAASGRFTSECDGFSSSMTTAAANAVAAGITIFASAGNNGYCDAVSWPACISFVNAVGAVYDAGFGTYYPCVSSLSCAPKSATMYCSTGYYATDYTRADRVTSYSNSASFLTLLAPGNMAYTTDIAGPGGYTSGNYTDSFGGTSAASPYAAGAAAVLQSAAKAIRGEFFSPTQVRTMLVESGDNVVDGKNGVVKPRINLGQAISGIKSRTIAPMLLLLNNS